MKHILAQIKDYTAKGIYLVIREFGTSTLQDLMDHGYKEGSIFKALKNLEATGLITKISRGVYRDANFT